MALSKKLRFEVFKRDGFACGYCGNTPPAVVLEVDHINPRSAGGDDDINNLLTACFGCNRGKKDIPLDKIPSSLVENLEVLQEKERQISAYNRYRRKIKNRQDQAIDRVSEIYAQSNPGWKLADHFKEGSLRQFLNSLHEDDVAHFMSLACNRFKGERAIRYFCGICWKRIRKE